MRYLFLVLLGWRNNLYLCYVCFGVFVLGFFLSQFWFLAIFCFKLLDFLALCDCVQEAFSNGFVSFFLGEGNLELMERKYCPLVLFVFVSAQFWGFTSSISMLKSSFVGSLFFLCFMPFDFNFVPHSSLYILLWYCCGISFHFLLEMS